MILQGVDDGFLKLRASSEGMSSKLALRLFLALSRLE